MCVRVCHIFTSRMAKVYNPVRGKGVFGWGGTCLAPGPTAGWLTGHWAPPHPPLPSSLFFFSPSLLASRCTPSQAYLHPPLHLLHFILPFGGDYAEQRTYEVNRPTTTSRTPVDFSHKHRHSVFVSTVWLKSSPFTLIFIYYVFRLVRKAKQKQ